MAKIFDEIRIDFKSKIQTYLSNEELDRKVDHQILTDTLEILINQQESNDIEKGENMTSLRNELIKFMESKLK